MHELALYAQCPAGRHDQVLGILSGLAAAQPQPYFTRTAIYSPIRSITADANLISKKKSQANGTASPAYQSVIQLNQQLRKADFGRTVPGPSAENKTWTYRVQEIPEPETKTVVLRRVNEGPLTPTQAATYQSASRFVNEYVIEGHLLVYRDIVLRLHRVLCFPTGNATEAAGESKAEPVGEDIRTTLPALDELALLDRSGAFVLEAGVRIEDRGKPALVQAATEQLMALRNDLKGAIELRVPERLALDTRIRD